jgi:5-hydroxyisourate hydrolase
MSPITTHVLDTATGKPAKGVPVRLEIASGPAPDRHWIELGRGVTDDDGRIREFEPPLVSLQPEIYRVRFDTGVYFTAMGVHAFYPVVHIIVRIDDPAQHFHIPLLLSPFGYSTYRGS